MSGGHFDYKEWHIQDMYENLENELERQGKEKSKEELWMEKEYYNEHPEERFNYTYPEEVQEKIREGMKALKIAYVYAKRIDYLLSGDDGEESFLKRLKEDLDEIHTRP